MGHSIRYCVFDVLGTLFPWKESFRFLHLLGRLGLESRLPDEELRRLFSSRIEEIFASKEGFWRFIAEAYRVDLGEVPEVVRRFDELLLGEATPHPKAEAILSELSGRYSLLLCSDTTGSTKNMVERAGLSKYFLGVFYSNDYRLTKAKGLYEAVLRAYRPAAPSEFVSIGDSANSDVEVPKKLGMRAIWVKNEALGLPSVEPDATVEDLGEVVRAVSILDPGTR
ncbi:MAG: HAD family hydrolase [Candidatus Brockarchaeota archaeon]|nr:HAD family hydrolase [Candidatus Brockarchaeota archaeon]